MKNKLNIFNLVWGAIFICIQIRIMSVFKSDHLVNEPYTLNEYIAKGGNTLDYFLGYLTFTVNDSASNVGIMMSLRDVLIIFLVALWSTGIDQIMFCWKTIFPKKTVVIPLYKEPSLKKFFRMLRYSFFKLVTTALSVYGIYYTFVYIIKFWHQ